MVEVWPRPIASLTVRGAAIAALLAPLWLADCGSSDGNKSGTAGSTGAAGTMASAGTTGSAGSTGSGGSGGSGGTGGTSGGGSQFCTEWAALFCGRIWECDPDAANNPFALGSEAQCAGGYRSLCAEPPSDSFSIDVNCSGGKQVNQAAKTSCLDRLNTVSCADFNAPTYDDDCELVCPG